MSDISGCFQDDYIAVGDNGSIAFAGNTAQVIATPGHTQDHVLYYFKNNKALFVGDTIFSLGCGRAFEGTTEELYNSIQKIKSSPKDTMLYSAHEYTASNAKFCLAVDPENAALTKRIEDVKKLQANDQPTLPVSLEMEMATNPFLRAPNVKHFTKIRTLRDKM